MQTMTRKENARATVQRQPRHNQKTTPTLYPDERVVSRSDQIVHAHLANIPQVVEFIYRNELHVINLCAGCLKAETCATYIPVDGFEPIGRECTRQDFPSRQNLKWHRGVIAS